MVVSIVCICYNQEAFVETAIRSVFAQSYPDIEVWVLDDASDDNSQQIINRMASEFPEMHLVLNKINQGHTKLFNSVLNRLNGDYVIDLAADDVLLPERVSEGVKAFADTHQRYGINFTNAEIIDENGIRLHDHYPVDERGKAVNHVPEGDVFKKVVSTYFINPSSMMFSKGMLLALHGYDEHLSYEDFDLWVRSARNYPYCYTDKVLVQKRVHSDNYSSKQYAHGSQQMKDTLTVCRKIDAMIKNKEERHAFHKRIGYEMRQCIRTGNFNLFFQYMSLL